MKGYDISRVSVDKIERRCALYDPKLFSSSMLSLVQSSFICFLIAYDMRKVCACVVCKRVRSIYIYSTHTRGQFHTAKNVEG